MIDESNLATQVRALKFRKDMPESELADALQICHRSRETKEQAVRRGGLQVGEAKKSGDKHEQQLTNEIGEARDKWRELRDAAWKELGAAKTRHDRAVALREKYYPSNRGTKKTKESLTRTHSQMHE